MALTGGVVNLAASQAHKNVSKNVNQAIGNASLDSLSPGARPPGHTEINWMNFNYPPLLRLIHYNLDELPTSLTGLVRCLEISFKITAFACCLNLLDTIIIVSTTEAPWKWVIQSLIHLMLLPTV